MMTAEMFRACRRNLVRWSRDRRGATAVFVALTATALIGFTGLGVETGLWYAIKRYNQSAADVAALSGAMEKAGGNSDICSLAKYAATANGFTSTNSCPNSCSSPAAGQMCVNNPPLFGGNGTNPAANYVEVILAQQQSTFFSFLSLASANVTIDTRAVAGFPNVTSCMLALSPSGTDLQDNGGGNATNLNIPNCSIISNSTSTRKPNNSILLHGNVKINAGAIDTAGNYRITGNSNSISPPIVAGIQPVADPYGTVTMGTPPTGTCTTINISSGTATLNPSIPYCSITISGGTLTVPAGVYYLVGGPVTCGKNGKNCSGPPGNLTISGGTITQTGAGGVTFVLTAQTNVSAAGSVQITGGTGSLTAPTQTGYLTTAAASTGLLIYQDPATSASSAANTIAPGGACNASLALTGAIYTPKTQDGLSGNQTAACSTCTELIAASFLFNGDTSLDTSQCTNFGVKTASVPGKVALSE
ncbi:MAG TPA: pilus assembly protein TadG-related protein [Stellaceae bacterium]|nr:pilus assembly protein TadG-related protein [Stellaceae bacterium]